MLYPPELRARGLPPDCTIAERAAGSRSTPAAPGLAHPRRRRGHRFGSRPPKSAAEPPAPDRRLLVQHACDNILVHQWGGDVTARTLVVLAMLGPLPAAELPVRQAVLYKHGIGYLERAGRLGPGESARLEFKAAEMDDVLKSLTVRDSSGRRIRGIRYDSSEPLEVRLAEFPFKIEPGAPLSSLLDALRGAWVDLNVGGQTLRGAIVSGRRTAAGPQQPERELVVLLLESGELRTVDLSAVTGMQLRDAALQRRLREYLERVDESRSAEKRSVYIDAPADGPRDLTVSYVIPMPAWKSSYRLLLADSGGSIEGWAIVDNTTGEDWNGVRLAVVSGRPVSFVSRLYEPKYVTRPGAELPEDRAQAPTVHAGAVGGLLREPEALSAEPRKAPALRMRVAGAPPPAAPRAELSTLAETAAAQELGELFEYSFPTPVTIRKGESAMLPFVQQKIQSRKLLIYSDRSSAHPLNAVELLNDTGKTLDGGPVTVYDGGAYGGEALMETLKASDKRLISYAVDLGTRVTTKLGARRDFVREVHLRRGVLISRQALQETLTYTVRNADQKPKTLLIEHPVRAGYELTKLKPLETTGSAYRFELKLPPGATAELPVEEERVTETTYSVANVTPDLLASFVQNKALGDSARKQLESIVELKRRIADVDTAIKQATQEFENLSRDQQRLRQNIESLNRVPGQQDLVQQYARQLAEREVRLAQLRDQEAGLRQKKAALESELNSLIEKIEF